MQRTVDCAPLRRRETSGGFVWVGVGAPVRSCARSACPQAPPPAPD